MANINDALDPDLAEDDPLTVRVFGEVRSALHTATGKPYDVWTYIGDEDTYDWGWPVYAAPADGDDEGHALADASLPGWVDWLVTQAIEG